MSCCALFLYSVFLVRIVFGPFTYVGVTVYHYASRFTTVTFVIMLTFNRVLKTLFILDFNRMAAISEQQVLICMALVTSISSLGLLVQEAVTRRILGLDQYGRECTNVYLGKVVLNL